MRRAAVISRLAALDTAGVTAVDEAADEPGLSRRQVYVLLGRRLGGVGPVPGRSSGGRGGSRLPDEVEAIVRQVLQARYLTGQWRSVAAVCREIARLCKVRGLQVPSRGTVLRRVAQLDPLLATVLPPPPAVLAALAERTGVPVDRDVKPDDYSALPGRTVQREAPVVSLQARLIGTLEIGTSTNCLVVRSRMGTGRFVDIDVAWPPGWSVALRDGTPALIDATGQLACRLGDGITVGGGFEDTSRMGVVSCTGQGGYSRHTSSRTLGHALRLRPDPPIGRRIERERRAIDTGVPGRPIQGSTTGRYAVALRRSSGATEQRRQDPLVAV